MMLPSVAYCDVATYSDVSTDVLDQIGTLSDILDRYFGAYRMCWLRGHPKHV